MIRHKYEMAKMNYQEARLYIAEASKSGIRPGLFRIRRILRLLGDPQDQKPVIHAAGTNGKGSVCTYIASILESAGLCCGRYISPAVFGYLEIIQTGGEWISKEAAADCITRIRDIVEEDAVLRTDPPTSFEIETAMAYLYLAESRADVLVIETGMGGRLDATNVIKCPAACVITSIGLDHTAYLGPDIPHIAAEKGGIICPGSPVICCSDDQDALDIITDICRQKGCILYTAGQKDIKADSLHPLSDPQDKTASGSRYYRRFSYKEYKDLETAMPGSYMPENAALAIETILAVKQAAEKRGEPACFTTIDEGSIRAGILKARWPGRFEQILDDPVYIVDGAHNPDGTRALALTAKEYFGNAEPILVMAVFADKNHHAMLREMASVSNTLITFCPPTARGLDAEVLAREAHQLFRRVTAVSSCREAVETALASARDTHRPILQFGTLSVLSETMEIIRRQKGRTI